MAMTMAQASAAMREAMRETVKKYSTWYLLEGVLLVIAGVVALIYPHVASVALVFVLGWILIISGVLQGIGLIGAKDVPHFWLQLISAVLALLIGILLLRNPNAGLLVMTTTLGSLFKVVTSFTAGHRITLALATFGIVSLPSRLIESLIALSIAYIAIENFMGKTLVHRWKITFLFGLVHGFGFSNVLREMALSRRSLAISLFSFNGGVELGQLVFVALVFPLVYLATSSRCKVRFVTASSVTIAALGLFWFVERALRTG